MKLRVKIFLSYILLIFLLFIITTFITGKVTLTSMQDEANYLGKAFVDTLNNSLANEILLGNIYFVDNYLKDIAKKNPMIEYIIILDEESKVFASAFKNDEISTEIQKNIYRLRQNETFVVKESKIFQETYKNFYLRMVDGLGYVIVVAINNNLITNTYKNVIFLLGVFFSGVVLFGLVLSYIVSYFVTNPINKIIDFSQVLINREFGKQLNTEGFISKDIKKLVLNINTLSNKLKEYEEKLKVEFGKILVSEKLHSINTFKAGFLHEIKNNITSLNLIVDSIDKNSLDDEDISFIKHEVKKMNKIIRELFSDSTANNEPKFININELLEEVVWEFKNDIQKLTKDVELTPEINKDIKLMRCHPELLKLAISNILKNALDAIRIGGKILLKTEERDDIFIVKILDNGIGFSDIEHMKMLTPFYSTKPEGTGLGLYFSYNVAKLHNGDIEIKRENDYTVINFYIRSINL